MKTEGHLDKARAFEERARHWDSDRDAPSVIEGIFNAAVHYIACGINQKHGQDIDSHAAQKRFLRDSDEDEVLDAFEALENIRIASVCGGAWNGDRIARALELLEVIKKWTGTGRPPD